MRNYFSQETTTTTEYVGSPGKSDTDEAWIKFYTKYRDEAVTYARRFLRETPDLAEDAFHNLIAKIKENHRLLKHKPNERFRPILGVLVRNEAIDLFRKERIAQHPTYVEDERARLENLDIERELQKSMLHEKYDFLAMDVEDPDYDEGLYSFSSRDRTLWIERCRGQKVEEIARAYHTSAATVTRAYQTVEDVLWKMSAAFLAHDGII